MIVGGWTEYRVLATGDGEKLERWGPYTLLRPDPQVIWHAQRPLKSYQGIDAVYRREGGGGHWEECTRMPAAWTVGYRDLTFAVRLMGFKHTGLFPEQAANWDAMTALVKGAGRPVSVLNLFAYTGGASVALAKAGATVTHVDAAKNMCERAGENARLSKTDGIRYIVDDCMKFVAREERRGKTYDAIVMDPPSYGRGANGELWKLEDNIHDFARATARILSPAPLFCLINSYTTGLQPAVMSNILQLTMPAGGVDAYELCLPTDEGIVLPCGCSAMWKGKV